MVRFTQIHGETLLNLHSWLEICEEIAMTLSGLQFFLILTLLKSGFPFSSIVIK